FANGFYEATVAHWNGLTWEPRQGHTASCPLRNSFFPDHWSRQQVMESIAETRALVTVDDWLPPLAPKRKSNAYRQSLPDGQSLIFYIGKPRRTRPSKVSTYTASVFPETR
ncbi:MAG: hypothetical protein AAFO69_03275, partial [Bacteroidota bacterium]